MYADIFIPLMVIPTLDIFLCKMLSNTARWFQLHAFTNLIITVIVFNDVKNYYFNLFDAIQEKTSNIDNNFIIILHFYHCLFFNLTKLDWFHHLVFILLGVLPLTLMLNTNIVRFFTFTGCGFPGFIEYSSLVLMKHGMMTSLQQKNINSYMYTYIRNPLAIFNCAFAYIAYKNNYLSSENSFVILYTILLAYFNGTFYNRLTIENYRDSYYKKIIYENND